PSPTRPADPPCMVWGGSGNKASIDLHEDFAVAAGNVLRQIRTGRSLSLRQVTVRSGGRFKPSSIASYERGERQISLERLFALADVYGVAAERIVAAIAHRLEAQRGGGRAANGGGRDVVVFDQFGREALRRR
ncbi:MAG: helix-turn-helix domain-containing protein, partial [Actinomycetota bacterium]